MARVLISGYYGFGNLGDELLLTALLRELRQLAPEQRVTVLSADPRATEARHQVEAVDRSRPDQVLPAVGRCDLLLSGGGSLLQDATSSRSLWYYLGLLDLAQRMGKDTFVYCQGAGPLLRPWNRTLTRQVLSRATAITLRDQASRRTLEALGVRRPMLVTADPVLSLPLRPGGRDRSQLAWIIHGRYCAPEVCEALTDVIKRLNRQGYTSWLLPFCPAEDGPALRQLALWGRVVPEAQLWSRLRQCGLVVSMRLHGLILGAKLRAELLSLTCDPKADAFLAELGRGPGLPLGELTGERLAEEVQAALTRPAGQDGPALERLYARWETGRGLFQEILTRSS